MNDHEDPASLLALAKKENARLIYFANPDNPMGTCWKANVVQDLIDNIPAGTLLMLDEAYHEFAEGTVPALDMANPNVLRFRTFSKAYGMAGVRVGYALGHPHLISAFDKIRNHFGVNRMGQAGAIAALADQDYLKTVQQRVARAREKIYAIAQFNGFGCVPSSTNFVAVDCGRDGAYARKILEGLAAHGIFRAHAGRGSAQPLHPDQRGNRRKSCRPRRSLAAGNQGRRLSAFLHDAVEVKPGREHGQAAVGVARPLVLGPVPIKLHPVLVRVAQVERFRNPVVRGPIELDIMFLQAPQGIAQIGPRRIKDGRVVKPCCARRRRRAAKAFPGIQAQMMMVATCRNKGRLVAISRLQLESQNAAIEIQRFLDIRNLQVHMANMGACGDGIWRLRHSHSLL